MIKLNLSKLKEQIQFYPNELQKTVLKNMRRFTVVVSGKRAGKSMLCAYLGFKELFLPYHVVWVIGKNYDVASRVWDYISEWIDRYFDGEKGPFIVNKHDKNIFNKLTGAKLTMKSAEEITSLLGKGLDLAIIDEAARIDAGIWDGYIRPNLMDRNGRAVLISNPFGYNWFFEAYQKGTQEGRLENPEYISFYFPTAIEDEKGEIIGSINPQAVSIEELKSIKATNPRDIWRSEYLGVFKEGAGQLFGNFERCIDDSLIVEDPNNWFEEPIMGHLYNIGVDIARAEDFTVICVIDRMNHRVVGFWRGNQVSWEYMREKLKEISQKYNDAMITLDTTGMGGDMFVESLSDIGVNVDTEYTFGNRSKMLLIDKLSLFLERGKIRFPKLSTLFNELQSFTYHYTDSGNIKYGSHKKDDCVIGLALACWNLNDEPLGQFFSNSIFGMRPRKYN